VDDPRILDEEERVLPTPITIPTPINVAVLLMNTIENGSR